jgi:hypothetical protein
MKTKETFIPWNGDLATLQSYDSVTLSKTLAFTEESGEEIYKGPLGTLGQLCIYLGYRLSDDNTLVFNGEDLMKLRLVKE